MVFINTNKLNIWKTDSIGEWTRSLSTGKATRHFFEHIKGYMNNEHTHTMRSLVRRYIYLSVNIACADEKELVGEYSTLKRIFRMTTWLKLFNEWRMQNNIHAYDRYIWIAAFFNFFAVHWFWEHECKAIGNSIFEVLEINWKVNLRKHFHF